MAKYQPIKIAGMSTGLVESREEFILPNDAYPVLQNAFVWRERIKRKKGCRFLGRLTRSIASYVAATTTLSVSSQIVNLFSTTSPVIVPGNGQIVPGSVLISITGGNAANHGTGIDDDFGNILGTINISLSSTINYITGDLNLVWNNQPVAAASNINISYSYYPNLPVVGIINREINSKNDEETIFFDTKYAYRYSGTTFSEYIAGTTWNGTDYQLFWGTNYWVSSSNVKLCWVTNFNLGDVATARPADPIRYTDGTTWTNFSPTLNVAGTLFLNQALALLPFRGRLLAFNTYEGNTNNITTTTAVQRRQRIRWSAIGNPLTTDAWKDDIRGQGGFLDIPTNQDIISVGMVRDNLVIYCERSTWQLRYTGRSIAPFQIEMVNAELGTESTFSAVQFDTSLVGFGDKAIVECDSFKSAPIDVKIPDLVFSIENQDNGNDRVVGIRDFQQRLAYWSYPITAEGYTPKFPNRRLVYNYENDSWATFQDSFTYYGNFQSITGITWAQGNSTWNNSNFPWTGVPALFPYIVAGNQQGFIEILDQLVSNDPTLYISNITSSGGTTLITSPDYNLSDFQVIQLTDLTDPFTSLNDKVYGVQRVDNNSFKISTFNTTTQDFDTAVPFPGGTFIGGGVIRVRDGFKIQSKKFNFLDEGENIQLGYIDVLMNVTDSGAVTMNIYGDYNEQDPLNTYPKNYNQVTGAADTFFNSIIDTTNPSYNGIKLERGSTKNWQRIYCSTRSSFITTQFTLSNAQLNGDEQQQDVQIDCQIMWVRKAGRQLNIQI
jgi:hypothetical protein